MTRLDRLLAQANPVPEPAPGHVTADQERLLASIVAVPPRRRRRAAIRLLVPISAAAVVALAVVLVLGRGTGVDDETEATAPGPVPATGEIQLIHVVTRLYGEVYGPGFGERLDGWLQPSTGRARIVITTGDEMTLQQVVGADDRVRSWQGALGNAGGMLEDRVDRDLAANLRALVRDRMPALVAFAKLGFRQDNTTFGAAATEPGEYRGRAVTIHRIAPTIKNGGGPSGYYFKWYTDPRNDEIVAFERGPVRNGRDDVEQGEELTRFETFGADAPLDELDWQAVPPTSTPTPPAPTATPTPSGPTSTPTPSGPTATPTRSGPTATPTPPGP